MWYKSLVHVVSVVQILNAGTTVLQVFTTATKYGKNLITYTKSGTSL